MESQRTTQLELLSYLQAQVVPAIVPTIDLSLKVQNPNAQIDKPNFRKPEAFSESGVARSLVPISAMATPPSSSTAPLSTSSQMKSIAESPSKKRLISYSPKQGKNVEDQISLKKKKLDKPKEEVYRGAYDDEETAAHAYDLAALKYWGQDTILNFRLSTYPKELKEMEGQSREEYIGSLRRKSSGFSRGISKYRGVARHHHNGRWEARIGRVFGSKYLYLWTYGTMLLRSSLTELLIQENLKFGCDFMASVGRMMSG